MWRAMTRPLYPLSPFRSLLPPPLAGEGWGGGIGEGADRRFPLPVPPPQAGEGTMWL